MILLVFTKKINLGDYILEKEKRQLVGGTGIPYYADALKHYGAIFIDGGLNSTMKLSLNVKKR